MAWGEFLFLSANGTLFHDLDFLDYHPSGRFEFHHLVVRDEKKIVAVLPGGLVTRDGSKWLDSPVGASVGGPVLQPNASIRVVAGILQAIQGHAKEQRLGGVRLTLAPSIYSDPPTDTIGYALSAAGFSLAHRWLSHALDLSRSEPQDLVVGFSKTRRYEVKRGAASLRVREGNRDVLETLYEILLDNQDAFGSVPTHTLDELRDLKSRFPKRVRVFLCSQSDFDIAGLVVFHLNHRLAYTFYICERQAFRGSLAPSVLIAQVARVLAEEGVKYLDLGPSSFDRYALNPGLAFFKESFGAVGVCRDLWIWSVENLP